MAMMEERQREFGWQRWLIYPPLLAIYVPIFAFGLIWPAILAGTAADELARRSAHESLNRARRAAVPEGAVDHRVGRGGAGAVVDNPRGRRVDLADLSQALVPPIHRASEADRCRAPADREPDRLRDQCDRAGGDRSRRRVRR